MRLWSVHPQYLDKQGLGGLWRETLLAQKVLRGETKGYRNHPQLERFRKTADPLAAIGSYLREIVNEACRRGYCYDESKILAEGYPELMPVTEGQLRYEWQHLQAKLKIRSPEVYAQNALAETPLPHPLLTIVPGEVEGWERVVS